MSQRARVWPVALSLVCVVTAHATSQEIRPGVWAAQEPQTLPLPVGGYSAYLVGELHGIQENAAFQLRYLMQLRAASGVRDVAIWTAAPSAEFLYIDPTRERVSLPSQDLIKMTVDAFLLLRSGTPLRNRCGA